MVWEDGRQGGAPLMLPQILVANECVVTIILEIIWYAIFQGIVWQVKIYVNKIGGMLPVRLF